MQLINKYKSFLALLALLLLFWLNFNLACFSHFHIDEKGQIVVHAHPYAKAEEAHNAASQHTHSRGEYIYLAAVYSVLTTFVFCLFLITLLLQILLGPGKICNCRINIGDIFLNAILRRGPPPISFSSV